MNILKQRLRNGKGISKEYQEQKKKRELPLAGIRCTTFHGSYTE